jgi:hypothetical protein
METPFDRNDAPRPEAGSVATEARQRSEARREAAPAAVAVLLVFAVLAVVCRTEGWELLGLPWWIWLVLGFPAFLLAVDLVAARRGRGLVRSRRAAVALLSLLVAGNVAALAILVAGLVTTSTSDLSGGELLLTGFAIYTTDVIVFGLLFWELESGGPFVRGVEDVRHVPEFRFPQDDVQRAGHWRPQVWDYLYVSLTNAIAFSPTDTMPMSLRAKALMGLESFISAVTVLLVAARAVNVLGA